MKSLFCISLAVLSVLSACKQNFRVTADYKEIPIVYGLLDQTDSIHYIRIQKAFLDQNTSAILQSSVPDSIYYPDILEVSIKELETDHVFNLSRINGDTIGILKEKGLFAQSPNILYRFSGILDPDRTYQLNILNTVTGLQVSSETDLVGKFKSIIPNPSYLIYWSDIVDQIISLSWKSADNAKVYQLSMDFVYKEIQNGTTDTVIKEVNWSIFNNRILYTEFSDYIFSFEFRTERFFQYMGTQIPENPNVSRIADFGRFHLTAGGNSLGDLIAHQYVQNGLTGAMASPEYTNIKNGNGIFSSRYQLIIENPFTSETHESLKNSVYTRHLGFK